MVNSIGIFCETALRCTSLDLLNGKSTLVHVMAWCRAGNLMAIIQGRLTLRWLLYNIIMTAVTLLMVFLQNVNSKQNCFVVISIICDDTVDFHNSSDFVCL